MIDAINLRVGQGYDVHRLVPGRSLVLGGVHIPSPVGLDGHSDADALLHAITDAILGATAQGDIGSWFSDTNPSHLNADSTHFLTQVFASAQQKGYALVNLDATLVCQAPKLAPYILAMRQHLANVFGLALDRVNIKAKTNEKLGYLGRQEAIEAQACVLMFLGEKDD